MISNKRIVVFLLLCLARKCYVLDAPIIKSITGTDDDGVFVEWKSINDTSDGAVLGYKILINEVKEKLERMYKLVNGDQEPGLVMEMTSEEVFGTMPLSFSKQIIAEGLATDNMLIDYIKPDVLHEIRVLTYTKDKESKLSPPWRVKLLTRAKDKRALAYRHLDECFLTIRHDDIATGTPIIYNNYI
ncbi:hypothetical protein KGM_212966 [Danaus plexippus plexippus]|uniref:Uncharacterized protein n=1 Tax=Danaus plexippus plexippus TaxID=278856 RepID=A0A212ELW0_DANPL|nr:hypothetical protein KGM_212966 [Danaus plexippus plexippus]